MFRNAHFDYARALFAEQFTPDGADYLYRKNKKHAPIRVSESERDAFIAAFDRSLRYTTWSIVLGMVLLILAVTLLDPSDAQMGHPLSLVACGVILLPCFLIYFRAWNAPARALERRPLAGAARTKEEMRDITFASMGYGQLGAVATIAVFLALGFSSKYDVRHGWEFLWIAGPLALIALAGVQAVRKWRHERK